MTGVGDFRVVAIRTTDAVEAMRLRADLSPVAAVALGRLISGAALLARLLDKGSEGGQQITLRVDGGGPLGLIIAEANTAGYVRGFVQNPRVDDPDVDVGRSIGSDGFLTVIRTAVPTGKPYTSQVRLVSGEIARDLAHFLETSEQIASGVMLGVHVSSGGIDAAGGMIVQRFPYVDEVDVEVMETLLSDAPNFSALLARMPLDDVVREVLRGSGYKALGSQFDVPIEFRCGCTRERALAPYRLLENEEIREMIEVEGGSVATCQFCGERYQFSPEDLREIHVSEE